jgi:type VI secretion system protein ImpE
LLLGKKPPIAERDKADMLVTVTVETFGKRKKMGAKELFDAGDLQGAIEQLTRDVKDKPRDVQSRIFLFESLCFAGDYRRAERQLDAIAQMSGDVKVELGTQLYRNILAAEAQRSALFAGSRRQPKFLAEPPAYAAIQLQAIAAIVDNRLRELDDLIKESWQLQMPVSGLANGTPFADFRDCDDLLAPFLEVFVKDEYAWLPFDQIKQIDIQAPRTLRDLLWMPAKIALRDGTRGDVFLPTLYHGSAQSHDDLIKLGRVTHWNAVSEEVSQGAGQRMFLVDETEQPILELRKIEFAA